MNVFATFYIFWLDVWENGPTTGDHSYLRGNPQLRKYSFKATHSFDAEAEYHFQCNCFQEALAKVVKEIQEDGKEAPSFPEVLETISSSLKTELSYTGWVDVSVDLGDWGFEYIDPLRS